MWHGHHRIALEEYIENGNQLPCAGLDLADQTKQQDHHISREARIGKAVHRPQGADLDLANKMKQQHHHIAQEVGIEKANHNVQEADQDPAIHSDFTLGVDRASEEVWAPCVEV